MANHIKGIVRGMAALSAERRREIASLGGRASALSEKHRRWTIEEARAAGRQGGLAKHRRAAERGDPPV